MDIRMNYNTEISGETSLAIRSAARHLRRDIEKVFFKKETSGCQIFLVKKEMPEESFYITVTEGKMEVYAYDDLGFIYGLYEISRSVLGVNEFWFWNDQEFEKKEEILINNDFECRSVPFLVKYRGWFVNDEVLIHTWMVDREKDKPWEMVFEALLRCGGNMVIPGTDWNAKKYAGLAEQMGLIITHHHAEPLGAEMFARAFPDIPASYDQYPEKFHALWEEAIRRQKGKKVIWNLGFRGQGDKPFWEEDARYRTDEARGKLISTLIKKQYAMVKEADRDAVCSTNLYGETMKLYQKGCLDLPEDVIKIWADNGYGKMVSRRQGNDNLRICSLPENKEEANGIYYHVSFYDLQAANHITMLPNSPEFVKQELSEALARGGNDFWIVNCSNVKPHVYFLDLIAQMWKNADIEIEKHRKIYVLKYFGMKGNGQIEERLKEYPSYAAAYGKREDEHAGEQFSNHGVRMFVTHYMKEKKKPCEDMFWAVKGEDLKKQIKWYEEICGKAATAYKEYLKKCELTADGLEEYGEVLFRDSVLLQVQIQYHCFSGAYFACRSMLEGLEENYKTAFFNAGKAKEEYQQADRAMREREHGKWHGFYENECLTDIKQTAWVLEGFMSYLRALGDGPHYYEWQREYLYSEKDRRVMLIMNMENHLRDEELFALMKEKEE